MNQLKWLALGDGITDDFQILYFLFVDNFMEKVKHMLNTNVAYQLSLILSNHSHHRELSPHKTYT